MLSTSGFSCRQSTPGAAVTEMKSRPKNTPSTSPVEKIAAASGEASASSGVAKSRVPASITRRPGRNLRVAGLGVVSVWISMADMWAAGRRGSSVPAQRKMLGDAFLEDQRPLRPNIGEEQHLADDLGNHRGGDRS